MKNSKYMILFAAVALFVSCENGFLSNESPSAMDASTVFSSSINTEQAIYGVYNMIGMNNSYLNRIACGYTGFNTDIEYSTKSTSTNINDNGLMLYDCQLGNSNVSNAKGPDIWSYLNTMIERSNNIIEGLETYGNVAKRDTMAEFLGEAYFLRSFAYLEQVKYWGDVPARFVSLAKDDNGVNAKKEDRNVIFEQLRIDLKKAADLLPWSEDRTGAAKNNVGRANKSAALALLARADLMYAGKAVRPNTIDDPTGYSVRFNIEDAAKRAEVYKEALEACAQIINHEDKLALDFAQPFKQICADVTSYKDMEHIWVLPFADGARGRVLSYNAPKLSSDAQKNVVGHLHGWTAGASSNGHVCVSPVLIYAFEKNDKRRAVTYVAGQWEYDNGNGEASTDSARIYIFPLDTTGNAEKLYQKHTQINTFFLGKYRFEWMAPGRAISGYEDGVDFPILRYADVLLMFAEAAIGGIGADVPANETGLDPLVQFNRIRTRAGVGTISTLNMEAIMQERAFELCGEYVRKWDLMRWGNLKQKVLKTAEQINKMSTFASRAELGIGDSIFYKYRFDTEINGYVMDSIYGLHADENTRPAWFSKERGWQAKDIFYSESKGNILSGNNYPIYSTEEKLESRQYWPIFSINIASSGGTLWNNYGYGN